MNLSMKEWNGLVYALSYYILGVIMTWLTYKIFGWGYRHFFGLHHVIGFLFWVGGLVWMVRLIVIRTWKSDRPLSVSAPVVHFMAVTASAIMVFQPWRKEKTEFVPDPKRQIIITMDSVTHQMNAVDGNGDTLLHTDFKDEKEGQ